MFWVFFCLEIRADGEVNVRFLKAMCRLGGFQAPNSKKVSHENYVLDGEFIVSRLPLENLSEILPLVLILIFITGATTLAKRNLNLNIPGSHVQLRKLKCPNSFIHQRPSLVPSEQTWCTGPHIQQHSSRGWHMHTAGHCSTGELSSGKSSKLFKV